MITVAQVDVTLPDVTPLDVERVDVQQELASLCGVINASHARLVAIVADALDDQSWAIAGVRSPEHWLTMRAGVSPVHARQVVGVARRRGELPSVMAEFASGQLSLDQVAVVVRYAPAHVEASVAELAVHASVPQLRRALSHYSFDPPAESGHTRQDTTFPTTTSEGPTSAAPNSDSSAATPQAANPQATNGVTATGEPDDTDSANGRPPTR